MRQLAKFRVHSRSIAIKNRALVSFSALSRLFALIRPTPSAFYHSSRKLTMVATGVIIILVAVLYVLFWIAVSAGIVYLFILIVKALKKYVNSKEVREEKKAVAKSLGEALKENRIRCQMTQEFVAETLGVSRQSVSKWENGSSDPNTSNLIALAKLYKISPEELLECATRTPEED